MSHMHHFGHFASIFNQGLPCLYSPNCQACSASFLEEFFSKTHLLESSLAAPCVAYLRAPWSRRCWTIGRALPHLDIDAEGTTIRRRENLQGRRVGPWGVVVGFGMGGGRDSEGSSGRGISEIPLSLHGSRAR